MPVPHFSSEEEQQLIDLLTQEQCSCVIRSSRGIRLFHERGIRDLYRLYTEEPEMLQGAFVADKVVGKGAVALMILGGVVASFAEVASIPALEMAARYGLRLTCRTQTDHIINRTKSDWCPVEKRCHHCQTPEACLPEIEAFIASLH